MTESVKGTNNGTSRHKSTLEWIPVSELEIDPDVQRLHLDLKKIERMRKNYNPDALGVCTVSKRNAVTIVVIDGMHRRQLQAEVTSGAGKLLCRVFTDLTPAEEALMFLDLNHGNQPNILDKFRMRKRAEDKVALEIDRICKQHGWLIQPGVANGVIQAVGAVEGIYLRSIKYDYEPNILDLTLRMVTHAWGNNHEGVQAVILLGVSALLAEHQDMVDVSILEKAMGQYESGPLGLRTSARAYASIEKGHVPMAVAHLLTQAYNRQVRGARAKLPAWRKRS